MASSVTSRGSSKKNEPVSNHPDSQVQASLRDTADQKVLAMLHPDNFGRPDVLTTMTTLSSVFGTRRTRFGDPLSCNLVPSSNAALILAAHQAVFGLYNNWRERDRVRIAAVGAIMCLNLNNDPPDRPERVLPLRVMHGWVDLMQYYNAADGTFAPDAGLVAAQAVVTNYCRIAEKDNKLPTSSATAVQCADKSGAPSTLLNALNPAQPASSANSSSVSAVNSLNVAKPIVSGSTLSVNMALCDPSVTSVRHMCMALREGLAAPATKRGRVPRSAARAAAPDNARVLVHYSGHGVPLPSMLGDIWVFDDGFTSYVPLPIADLVSWTQSPLALVIDTDGAGAVIPFLPKPAPTAAPHNSTAPDSGGAPSLDHDILAFAACAAGQLLPQTWGGVPGITLPSDFFTSILVSPLRASLLWAVAGGRVDVLMPRAFLRIIDTLPGRMGEKGSPVTDLYNLLVAVTDTIAWERLPPPLFSRFFRRDPTTAALCRNYLLADRIMRQLGVTPMVYPTFPTTHDHPLWTRWDWVVTDVITQLPAMLGYSTYDLERMAAYSLVPEVPVARREATRDPKDPHGREFVYNGYWGSDSHTICVGTNEASGDVVTSEPNASAAIAAGVMAPAVNAHGETASVANETAPPVAPVGTGIVASPPPLLRGHSRRLLLSTLPTTTPGTTKDTESSRGEGTSLEAKGTSNDSGAGAMAKRTNASTWNKVYSRIGNGIDPLALPIPPAASATAAQRVSLLRYRLRVQPPTTSIGHTIAQKPLNVLSYKRYPFFDETLISFETWCRHPQWKNAIGTQPVVRSVIDALLADQPPTTSASALLLPSEPGADGKLAPFRAVTARAKGKASMPGSDAAAGILSTEDYLQYISLVIQSDPFNMAQFPNGHPPAVSYAPGLAPSKAFAIPGLNLSPHAKSLYSLMEYVYAARLSTASRALLPALLPSDHVAQTVPGAVPNTGSGGASAPPSGPSMYPVLGQNHPQSHPELPILLQILLLGSVEQRSRALRLIAAFMDSGVEATLLALYLGIGLYAWRLAASVNRDSSTDGAVIVLWHRLLCVDTGFSTLEDLIMKHDGIKFVLKYLQQQQAIRKEKELIQLLGWSQYKQYCQRKHQQPPTGNAATPAGISQGRMSTPCNNDVPTGLQQFSLRSPSSQFLGSPTPTPTSTATPMVCDKRPSLGTPSFQQDHTPRSIPGTANSVSGNAHGAAMSPTSSASDSGDLDSMLDDDFSVAAISILFRALTCLPSLTEHYGLCYARIVSHASEIQALLRTLIQDRTTPTTLLHWSLLTLRALHKLDLQGVSSELLCGVTATQSYQDDPFASSLSTGSMLWNSPPKPTSPPESPISNALPSCAPSRLAMDSMLRLTFHSDPLVRTSISHFFQSLFAPPVPSPLERIKLVFNTHAAAAEASKSEKGKRTSVRLSQSVAKQSVLLPSQRQPPPSTWQAQWIQLAYYSADFYQTLITHVPVQGAYLPSAPAAGLMTPMTPGLHDPKTHTPLTGAYRGSVSGYIPELNLADYEDVAGSMNRPRNESVATTPSTHSFSDGAETPGSTPGSTPMPAAPQGGKQSSVPAAGRSDSSTVRPTTLRVPQSPSMRGKTPLYPGGPCVATDGMASGAHTGQSSRSLNASHGSQPPKVLVYAPPMRSEDLISAAAMDLASPPPYSDLNPPPAPYEDGYLMEGTGWVFLRSAWPVAMATIYNAGPLAYPSKLVTDSIHSRFTSTLQTISNVLLDAQAETGEIQNWNRLLNQYPHLRRKSALEQEQDQAVSARGRVRTGVLQLAAENAGIRLVPDGPIRDYLPAQEAPDSAPFYLNDKIGPLPCLIPSILTPPMLDKVQGAGVESWTRWNLLLSTLSDATSAPVPQTDNTVLNYAVGINSVSTATDSTYVPSASPPVAMMGMPPAPPFVTETETDRRTYLRIKALERLAALRKLFAKGMTGRSFVHSPVSHSPAASPSSASVPLSSPITTSTSTSLGRDDASGSSTTSLSSPVPGTLLFAMNAKASPSSSQGPMDGSQSGAHAASLNVDHTATNSTSGWTSLPLPHLQLCAAAHLAPLCVDPQKQVRLEATEALAAMLQHPVHQPAFVCALGCLVLDTLSGGGRLLQRILRRSVLKHPVPASGDKTAGNTTGSGIPPRPPGAAGGSIGSAVGATKPAPARVDKGDQLRRNLLRRMFGKMHMGTPPPAPARPAAAPAPPPSSSVFSTSAAMLELLGIPLYLLPTPSLSAAIQHLRIVYSHAVQLSIQDEANAFRAMYGSNTTVSTPLSMHSHSTHSSASAVPPTEDLSTTWLHTTSDGEISTLVPLTTRHLGPEGILYLSLLVTLLSLAANDPCATVAGVAANALRACTLRLVQLTLCDSHRLLPQESSASAPSTSAGVSGTGGAFPGDLSTSSLPDVSEVSPPSITPTPPDDPNRPHWTHLHEASTNTVLSASTSNTIAFTAVPSPSQATTLSNAPKQLTYQELCYALYESLPSPFLAQYHASFSEVHLTSLASLTLPILPLYSPSVEPSLDPLHSTSLAKVTRQRLIYSALLEATALSSTSFSDSTFEMLVASASKQYGLLEQSRKQLEQFFYHGYYDIVRSKDPEAPYLMVPTLHAKVKFDLKQSVYAHLTWIQWATYWTLESLKKALSAFWAFSAQKILLEQYPIHRKKPNNSALDVLGYAPNATSGKYEEPGRGGEVDEEGGYFFGDKSPSPERPVPPPSLEFPGDTLSTLPTSLPEVEAYLQLTISSISAVLQQLVALEQMRTASILALFGKVQDPYVPLPPDFIPSLQAMREDVLRVVQEDYFSQNPTAIPTHELSPRPTPFATSTASFSVPYTSTSDPSQPLSSEASLPAGGRFLPQALTQIQSTVPLTPTTFALEGRADALPHLQLHSIGGELQSDAVGKRRSLTIKPLFQVTTPALNQLPTTSTPQSQASIQTNVYPSTQTLAHLGAGADTTSSRGAFYVLGSLTPALPQAASLYFPGPYSNLFSPEFRPGAGATTIVPNANDSSTQGVVRKGSEKVGNAHIGEFLSRRGMSGAMSDDSDADDMDGPADYMVGSSKGGSILSYPSLEPARLSGVGIPGVNDSMPRGGSLAMGMTPPMHLSMNNHASMHMLPPSHMSYSLGAGEGASAGERSEHRGSGGGGAADVEEYNRPERYTRGSSGLGAGDLADSSGRLLSEYMSGWKNDVAISEQILTGVGYGEDRYRQAMLNQSAKDINSLPLIGSVSGKGENGFGSRSLANSIGAPGSLLAQRQTEMTGQGPFANMDTKGAVPNQGPTEPSGAAVLSQGRPSHALLDTSRRELYDNNTNRTDSTAAITPSIEPATVSSIQSRPHSYPVGEAAASVYTSSQDGRTDGQLTPTSIRRPMFPTVPSYASIDHAKYGISNISASGASFGFAAAASHSRLPLPGVPSAEGPIPPPSPTRFPVPPLPALTIPVLRTHFPNMPQSSSGDLPSSGTPMTHPSMAQLPMLGRLPAAAATPAPEGVPLSVWETRLREAATVTPRLSPLLLTQTDPKQVKLARSAALKLSEKHHFQVPGGWPTNILYHPYLDLKVTSTRSGSFFLWGTDVPKLLGSWDANLDHRSIATPHLFSAPGWTKSFQSFPAPVGTATAAPSLRTTNLRPSTSMPVTMTMAMANPLPGISDDVVRQMMHQSVHAIVKRPDEVDSLLLSNAPGTGPGALPTAGLSSSATEVTSMTWIDEHDACHLLTASSDGVVSIWSGDDIATSLLRGRRRFQDLSGAGSDRLSHSSRGRMDGRGSGSGSGSGLLTSDYEDDGDDISVHGPAQLLRFQALPEINARGLDSAGTGGAVAGLQTVWMPGTNTLVAGGGTAPFLRLWDLSTHRSKGVLPLPTNRMGVPLGSVTCLTTPWPGTNVVVAGTNTGGIYMFDTRLAQSGPTVLASNLAATSSSSPYAPHSTSGTFSSSFGYSSPSWSLSGAIGTGSKAASSLNAVVAVFKEHSSYVTNVQQAKSQSSYSLVSGSATNADVRLWDLRSSRSLFTIMAHRAGLSSLVLHDYAPLIATGSVRQQVRIFSNTGDLLKTIKYLEGFTGRRIGQVSTLAFHPHRLQLAVGGMDGTVSVYHGVPN